MDDLREKSLKELREEAKKREIFGRSKAKSKEDLIKLIRKHEKEKREYAVGMTSIGERDFVPLCSSYPNIKGATCEEIEAVVQMGKPNIDDSDASKSFTMLNDLVGNTKYIPSHKLYEDYRDLRKFARERYGFWLPVLRTSDALGLQKISDELSSLKMTAGYGTLEAVKIQNMQDRLEDSSYRVHIPKWVVDKYNQYLKNIESYEEHPLRSIATRKDVKDAKRFLDRIRQNALSLSTTADIGDTTKKERRELFKHIKMYDRDEMFDALKSIGNKLNKRIRDKEGVRGNPVRDKSTIFVTIPRGGHEVLATFAQANEISDVQIPSDIEKNGELKGMIWNSLKKTKGIKRIVIIDDIIASGQEMASTVRNIKEALVGSRPINIYLAHLGRRITSEQSSGYAQNIGINEEDQIFDKKTIGLGEFRKRLKDGTLKPDDLVTASFPHACADGRADQALHQLFGESRCSPSARLSRTQKKKLL